jgi:heavy metal sensor kinase
MNIRSLPIGAKLTAWYFLITAIGMVSLGWLAHEGMRRSIRATVDEQLADKVAMVRQTITSDQAIAHAKLVESFGEESSDTLLQIRDENGDWLYRSRRLRSATLPWPERNKHFSHVTLDHMPLRMITETVRANGHTYYVQAATEIDDYIEAIRRFQKALLLIIPVVLVVATLAGYLMSRRALAPVAQITAAASEITYRNLSSRVDVPQTGDELSQLAQTFNAMLDRIESSMKRISQFTADASHELRTPVSIMRTRAELALRKERSAAEYQRTIQELHVELVRTSELVERLMLLARSDAGAELVQQTRLNISEIARNALDQVRPLIEHKGLMLQGTAPGEDIWCDGDPQLLRQLFVILLDNAVKYTTAYGTIAESLKVLDGRVTYIVADSGIGIESSDLPHIFDRFYRADKARSRESGGAGLGLAIAHWIVEAHHGRITAESTPGIGTTFRVELPTAIAQG